MGYSSGEIVDRHCASLGFHRMLHGEELILLTADCWVFGFWFLGWWGKRDLREVFEWGLVGADWVGGGGSILQVSYLGVVSL